jgi:Domain of unknown function (DUF4249)
MRIYPLFLAGAVVLMLTASCDTVQPEKTGLLVIEAYFNADRPLPRVSVHESAPIGASLRDVRVPVRDADVVVTHNDISISFVPVTDSAGVYKAPDGIDLIMKALDTVALRVRYEDQEAGGTGLIPPPVTISNVKIISPERAIEAVLIDSLNLGLDSLNVAIIASEGYIFPVEVEVSWLLPEGSQDQEEFWIQTRLDPVRKFSSSLLDFFLLSEQVLQEYDIDITTDVDSERVRRWTGIYAVPVQNENDVLPAHDLKISLLRSGPDYARLVTTAKEPDQRSPSGNIYGGIGFVGGISVDSLSIPVQ